MSVITGRARLDAACPPECEGCVVWPNRKLLAGYGCGEGVRGALEENAGVVAMLHRLRLPV